MPFTIKESVDREIDHLVENGTLYPVEHSKLAGPIVPAPRMRQNRLSDNSKSLLIHT